MEKYSSKGRLTRSSSPKILLSCPALFTMTEGPWVLGNPEMRGRIFELAVGAQLLQLSGELFYWREKNAEVDFVFRYQGKLYAIEVKSARRKSAKGLEVFSRQFPEAGTIILTTENFPIFSEDPIEFLTALG
ncbi:MAG: DUF4143 domain-containing protein [Candidatus Riflebacteria bacterium]|nr:DUF4143 domain-containing protein [Candidatus Riflebacteria bacterium]